MSKRKAFGQGGRRKINSDEGKRRVEVIVLLVLLTGLYLSYMELEKYVMKLNEAPLYGEDVSQVSVSELVSTSELPIFKAVVEGRGGSLPLSIDSQIFASPKDESEIPLKKEEPFQYVKPEYKQLIASRYRLDGLMLGGAVINGQYIPKNGKLRAGVLTERGQQDVYLRYVREISVTLEVDGESVELAF